MTVFARSLIALTAAGASLALAGCAADMATEVRAHATTSSASASPSSAVGASPSAPSPASPSASESPSSSASASGSESESSDAPSESTTSTIEEPAKLANPLLSAYPSNGAQVGSAQPIVVHFSSPVTNRDAIEKQLKVTDSAGVKGAWRWLSSTRVDYRPAQPWPVGDTVTLEGSVDGVDTSDETVGSGSVSKSFTVVSDLRADINLDTFTMKVSEGGTVIRTLKMGSGKKDFESLTGKMVVLGKAESVHMTSCSVGFGCKETDPEYYDEDVPFATQITTSGMYLHGAPWDKQIGKVNSSHGCIHLSLEDAKWFYSKAIPGTLVNIVGQPNPVSVSNGEGDWNLSWAQWLAPEQS